MIEEYKEKINVDTENLNTMPKNNMKNIKAYITKLNSLKKSYEKDYRLVYEEIKRRNIKYQDCAKNKEIDILNNNIRELEECLPLLNTFSSSYTKSGLDSVLYDLSHFYTVVLEKVNEDILKAILIFKKVSISLASNDFYYSYYSSVYMEKFLSCIYDNGNINNEELKTFFEKIYWKCPDIITHIVINFKYLFCLNRKKFDDYYGNLLTSLNNQNIRVKYNNTTAGRDNLILNDYYTIIHCFLDKIENVNNYSEDKINMEYKKIFNTTVNNNYDDILKLYHSLNEYKYYLRYKYIVDDIRKLHNDRSKYKGISLKSKKEIVKIERNIFKINKKVNRLRDNFGKFDKLNSLVNSYILELEKLYTEYENNVFLEKIALLGDNPTLYDMLLVGSSNYNYLVSLIKNDTNDILFVNKEIKELNDFIYYPYINIVNNMWLNDEREIKHIIMDRFNLFGFDISEEELDDSNLDSLINTTKIVLIHSQLVKLGIDINKIRFVLNTRDIIK